MIGLIDKLRRARHLSEERLFDCYLAERAGDAVDPPAAEHLADCTECHRRYADLSMFMDDTWSEGDREVADIFTPERLQLQQAQIARRLESLSHAARVISFPAVSRQQSVAETGDLMQRTTISSRVFASRWVAAAAAAGLFVGVGAGIFYDSHLRSAAPNTTGVTQASGSPVLSVQAVEPDPPDDSNDDALFMLELQGSTHSRGSLRSFDALTPRARDIDFRVQ